MNVLQHTRNELNLCLKDNRADRSYRDTLLNLLIHENESCSAGLLKETLRFEDENDYDYT